MQTHVGGFKKSGQSLIVAAACLTAALFFACTQARAQSYVYNAGNFATGQGPSGIIAADLNGDGIIDLAVANDSADNTVSILLGKPNGGFAPHVDYATGPGAIGLVAADLNGDGKLDLAVIGNNPNVVSILIGNGDGTFQPHVDYALPGRPVGIVAGDFNGDHRVDLAIADADDSSVLLLLGNGDGTFQAPMSTPVGNAPSALGGADFNGDGKQDLVTLNYGDSSVTVLLSNGNGTFRRVDSTAGMQPMAFAIGDFNGDSKLDIVINGTGLGGAILLGNGDGSFETPIALPQLSSGDIVAGDFNHDGKQDVALCTNSSPSSPITVLLGNGDGSFQAPIYSTVASPAGGAIAVDANGDGKLDLAMSDPDSAALTVLLGNGDGTFGLPVTLALPSQHGIEAGPTVVADFNGDGKADIVVAQGQSGTPQLTVFPGNGDGTFRPSISSPINTGSQYANAVQSIAVGDFNGDGKADCAALIALSQTIAVLLGNGDGAFQSSILTTLPGLGAAIAAGDFNQDGKLDVAVTYQDNSGVAWLVILLGHGDGTFTSGAQYQIGPAAYNVPDAIVASDFNHDGKLDIAVTNPLSQSTVLVFIGLGDGSFRDPVSYPVPFYPLSIATGDFNGDTNTDLVVGSGTALSVLLGKGDGTFQSHIYSSLQYGAVNLAVEILTRMANSM
jgi:FG-GAP-like repeat/FG-GAP repeat